MASHKTNTGKSSSISAALYYELRLKIVEAKERASLLQISINMFQQMGYHDFMAKLSTPRRCKLSQQQPLRPDLRKTLPISSNPASTFLPLRLLVVPSSAVSPDVMLLLSQVPPRSPYEIPL